jgi:hypothetical protein
MEDIREAKTAIIDNVNMNTICAMLRKSGHFEVTRDSSAKTVIVKGIRSHETVLRALGTPHGTWITRYETGLLRVVAQ